MWSPRQQTQIQQLTTHTEVVEAENVGHDVAEERQIQQQRSQFSVEKKMEATQGLQGTLQDLWEGNHIPPQRQRAQYHLELSSDPREPRAGGETSLSQLIESEAMT